MTSKYPNGIESGLRATSDSLLATLEALVQLETEKRGMVPGSPEFVELARRIEGLASAALADSTRQEALAERTARLTEVDGPPARPIEEIPPRPIHQVLADWRDAERRYAEAQEGSDARDRAQAEAGRFRDEYLRAQKAALARQGQDRLGGS